MSCIVITVLENKSTAISGACITIDGLIFTWGLKLLGQYCIIHNGLLLFHLCQVSTILHHRLQTACSTLQLHSQQYFLHGNNYILLTIALCIFYLIVVQTVGPQKGSICMTMKTVCSFGSVRLIITFSSLHQGFISLQGCYVNLTDLKDGINQTKWLGGRVVVIVNSALVFDTVPYTLTLCHPATQKDVIALPCIVDGSRLSMFFLHDVIHMRLSAGLTHL
jgi:hypothetical protein